MVNYNRLAATSERLITRNGRMIRFKRPDPNGPLIDPDKPWNGRDPNSPPITLELPAVFAPPNTVRQFGLTALGEGLDVQDLFSFVQTMFILFPGENDIKQFPILEDQGKDYNVVAYQLLQPANRKLVAFVGARR